MLWFSPLTYFTHTLISYARPVCAKGRIESEKKNKQAHFLAHRVFKIAATFLQFSLFLVISCVFTLPDGNPTVFFIFAVLTDWCKAMILAPSSKESTNYARLCRLLVDGGTQALRLQFDKIHPPASLDAVLKGHHPTLKMLRNIGVLNGNQWEELYPAVPSSSSVSSEQFDIRLLTVLLKHICGLTPPRSGWESLPPSSDKSVEANIAKIKYYRNRFYAHAIKASVDDATFNTLWQDISAALKALGVDANSINKMESEGIDPYMERNYRGLLQQCQRDENSIKEKLDDITGTTV